MIYDQGLTIDESIDASDGNGESFIVPTNALGLTVTLKITSGTGKIQTTDSPVSAIQGGTAVWCDWDDGAVSATKQGACFPAPRGIRQVCSAGATRMLVTFTVGAI